MQTTAFFDSHVHLINTGLIDFLVDLFEQRSVTQIKASLESYAANYLKTHFEAPIFIGGRGFNRHFWEQFPTYNILDDISCDFPIILIGTDGHSVWCNSFVLSKFNIFKDTFIEGGEILKNSAGELLGILVDNACLPIYMYANTLLEANHQDAILSACAKFNKNGITTVCDMGISESDYKTLLQTYLAHSPTLHNIFYLNEIYLFTDISLNLSCDDLIFGGYKVFLDGAFGSEGAALLEPYRSKSGAISESKGLLLKTDNELIKIIDTFIEKKYGEYKRNIMLSFHVIGDRALHQILSILQLLKNDPKVFKNAFLLKTSVQEFIKTSIRLEHVQLTNPELSSQIKDLGPCLAIQPSHLVYDSPWVPAILGESRFANAYTYSDFVNTNRLIGGSDSPIDIPNSLYGIYCLSREYGEKILVEKGINLYNKPAYLQKLIPFTRCLDIFTVSPNEVLFGNKCEDIVYLPDYLLREISELKLSLASTLNYEAKIAHYKKLSNDISLI